MTERFAPPLLLGPEETSRLVTTLAALGVAGGAVYDAIVAMASRQHGAVLATRDARARSTYEAVGATVVIAG